MKSTHNKQLNLPAEALLNSRYENNKSSFARTIPAFYTANSNQARCSATVNSSSYSWLLKLSAILYIKHVSEVYEAFIIN